MKKYMRLDDCIVETSKTYFGEIDTDKKIPTSIKHELEITRCICKQADTIEELCDCFVVEYPDGEKEVFDAKNYSLEEAKNCYDGYPIENLYGAIWVSTGLKYAAILNSDDELELIPPYYAIPSKIKTGTLSETEMDIIRKSRLEICLEPKLEPIPRPVFVTSELKGELKQDIDAIDGESILRTKWDLPKISSDK